MKVKIDFVTNSSSSNFLVVFPRPVENFEDVKEHIFYTEHADVVFKDCKKQIPFKISIENENLRKFVYNQICCSFIPGYKWYRNDPRVIRIEKELDEKYYQKGDERAEYWSEFYKLTETIRLEYDEINKQTAMKLSEEFINKNVGGYVYLFKYSDEEGRLQSDMEHGDIFRYLPHLHLSHH